jgi:nicotinate-nucleotide--dimethylbenzimidazole phosphoribosyltransferase
MKQLSQVLNRIKPIDKTALQATQLRLDNLTKPIGSLGWLEDMAKLVVAITGQDVPSLDKKVVFTLAADHGVIDEKVSAYPKEVTPQMVYNFLRNGAAVNVLSNYVGAKVVIIDIGVAVDLDLKGYDLTNFRLKKIGYGTKNFAKGPAMTREDAIKSIETGIELVEEQLKSDTVNAAVSLIGIGEMGIGNTTAASAISSVITGVPVEQITGKGTGIDDSVLKHKIDVIKKSVDLNKPDPTDAIDVLSKLGGYEIGGMAGIIIAGIANRVPVILDGFISGAAALIAVAIKNELRDYLIAGHCSAEPGHKIVLDYLGIKPLLSLGMRLGEGTGAVLAMPIVESSIKILTQMATFGSAGVSTKE